MLRMDRTLDFSKVGDAISPPGLVEIQTASYERFLQTDTPPQRRKNEGLEALLREIFPIVSYDGKANLEYVNYELSEPRYTSEECRQLRLSYGRPFRIRCRLKHKDIKGVLEESIYMGDMPAMIGGGEFIINGAERVIVSQLHRSPGVDFTVEFAESDRPLHGARIIPERGSWIEMGVTKKEVLAIRIDQSSKFPLTTFLRAMDESYGTTEAILRLFYETDKISPADARAHMYAVEPIINPKDGEILVEAGHQIGDAATTIQTACTKKIEVINKPSDEMLLNTLIEDHADSHETALLMIYARLRPGNPPQAERAKTLFKEKFYDENRYRLGKVGRFRLSRKFQQSDTTVKDVPDEKVMTLEPADMVNIVRYILYLRTGEGVIDDIDHLGNRRLRTIDELAGDEIRKGFLKLRRTVQERISMKDPAELTKIAELVNSKSVSASVEYFFGRSELSQVVDQTNPLSQLTHERRLSALGPGGLNRKRAGFEVRDVHISHYGRICPIETPEGNNIGLISSLSLFASVDEFGFLTTPYQQVRNGRLTENIKWLRADEESEAILAPPDVLKDDDSKPMTAVSGRTKRKIPDAPVLVRARSEVSLIPGKDIEYLDVSPKQTVGISAALIPFLEHDDANRALMGSNMQRQAVPLIRTEAPLVATGLEKVVAADSGMVVRAQKAGTVTYADSKRIVIDNVDEYELRKFARLNERTCMNQKPIVKAGQRVRKNEIIADGPACSNGELALGKNILTAFVPFDGYNFEDAILISEKLVKNDVFTSVHIEEYDVEVRETKLGKEEFTRDIPNVSEKALRNLDAAGIVCLGTRVKTGDTLVGKVSPKSKSELTPEEKLLHAIFGRAGEDVKNDSLELPAGEEGIVVSTKRFSRRVQMSDERKKALNKEMKQYSAVMDEKAISVFRTMCEEINEVVGSPMVDPSTRQKVGVSDISEVILEQIEGFNTRWIKGKGAAKERAEAIYQRYWPTIEKIESEKQRKLSHMKRGDELPSGVLEMVKVYVITKRKLAVGDKMAGRHGNKGVIARIMPEEDMPFLSDGTPVDICLNPLGVPSRMNVGQILETHLGWAAAVLGFKAITPVFDGATEAEITQTLAQANEHVRKRLGKDRAQPDQRTTQRIKSISEELRRVQQRQQRLSWIEENLEAWRKKYIEVGGELEYLLIPMDSDADIDALEFALALEYPDASPRMKMKGEWDYGPYLPRFNAWFSKWTQRWGADPKEAKRKVLDEVDVGALEACKKVVNESGDDAWTQGFEALDAEPLKSKGRKPGVYVFRNCKTKQVSEGYVGEAAGQTLRQRLRHHFKDEFSVENPQACGDNLWRSWAREETHLLKEQIGSLKQKQSKESTASLPAECLEAIQNAGATGELLAEMPLDGKTVLYDGRTGEPFEQKVTVGYMYMNKLHHLVDDKIHARSTGPYSLITQQPLGGKARTGGQRFGEMEVWALESYGASYMLQEMLTVKSDDVEGRTKIYEAMVKGVNTLDAGTPVSFDVLCNELRGLGLNIQLEKKSLI